MAKGCSAALAVIWIATVAHALTTPVSMVLTPSTGGLGVQRLLPSIKNKVAPKASALWEKTTTKIETIRDRVTGKTDGKVRVGTGHPFRPVGHRGGDLRIADRMCNPSGVCVSLTFTKGS